MNISRLAASLIVAGLAAATGLVPSSAATGYAVVTEGFEGASLSPAWHVGGTPSSVALSTAQAHSGLQSLLLDATTGHSYGFNAGGSLSQDFAPLPSGTATAWYYDGGQGCTTTGGTDSLLTVMGTGADGVVGRVLAVGAWTHIASCTYVVETPDLAASGAATFSVTAAPRSVGWHQFQIAWTPQGYTLRVDGAIVSTGTDQVAQFQTVKLSNLQVPLFGGNLAWFDDVEVDSIAQNFAQCSGAICVQLVDVSRVGDVSAGSPTTGGAAITAQLGALTVSVASESSTAPLVLVQNNGAPSAGSLTTTAGPASISYSEVQPLCVNSTCQLSLSGGFGKLGELWMARLQVLDNGAVVADDPALDLQVTTASH
ncbi:MAG: hypothetical protein ACYDAY_00825 [Candidatus Dormibacteria bacterium]